MTNDERAPLRAALVEAVEMLEHESADVRGFGLKRIRGVVESLRDVKKPRTSGKGETTDAVDAATGEGRR